MKFLLVHRNNDELGAQWRRFFGSHGDHEIIQGDICQIQTDAVVSPANSFGFMDGGLDLALSQRFGWGLQETVRQAISERPLRELLVGEAIVVRTGDEKVPWLISAPTMRVPMRLRQTVNAYLAMKAILIAAQNHTALPEIATVAIPGLGTGCGALDAETAALQMWMAYREVILEDVPRTEDFGKAQKAHFELNAKEINLWDR